MEFTTKEHEETFYHDGNVLYLNWGGDYMGYINTPICTLKM